MRRTLLSPVFGISTACTLTSCRVLEILYCASPNCSQRVRRVLVKRIDIYSAESKRPEGKYLSGWSE
jgi:hypothetical protein